MTGLARPLPAESCNLIQTAGSSGRDNPLTRKETKRGKMHRIKNQLSETVPFLKSKTKVQPKIGLILGTGMARVAEIIEAESIIPYNEIPHFAVSTVESHAGNLILGHLEGVPVLAMQGRFHFYEGYDMKTITYPVRVMKALGIDTMLVSNAAGALNPLFEPGDVMLMTDHINLMGDSPLRGVNDPELGVRFPDMSRAYTPELRKLAEKVALEKSIRLVQGVYVALMGPNLETAAEYRFLRTIGADTVGMSTVPEVTVAVHSSMRVLGFSLITDMCLPDALEPATLEKILAVADMADEKLSSLVAGLVPQIEFSK